MLANRVPHGDILLRTLRHAGFVFLGQRSPWRCDDTFVEAIRGDFLIVGSENEKELATKSKILVFVFHCVTVEADLQRLVDEHWPWLLLVALGSGWRLLRRRNSST